MENNEIQILIILIWAILTIYLINYGGRNNRIFHIVVQSGFRLILIGAVAAALVITYKDPTLEYFTTAAMNFILILSSAVGASYIAHANMSLRDNPNTPSKTENSAIKKDNKLLERK